MYYSSANSSSGPVCGPVPPAHRGTNMSSSQSQYMRMGVPPHLPPAPLGTHLPPLNEALETGRMYGMPYVPGQGNSFYSPLPNFAHPVPPQIPPHLGAMGPGNQYYSHQYFPAPVLPPLQSQEEKRERRSSASRKKENVCQVCFKSFSRPSSLLTHSYIHSGHRPHVCPWPECGKEFNVKSNMIRHYKLHEKKVKDKL